MPGRGSPSRPFFARPKVQLWVFGLGACLEASNAMTRASRGSFGKGFWFFVVATVFFLLMAGLVLWQRKHPPRRPGSGSHQG